MTPPADDTATLTDVLRFGAGEVILFPGEPEGLYRVASGLVRIQTVDGRRSGLTLRYVKPGGWFGEEALTGVVREYFAEALTDTEVEVRAPAALDEAARAELTVHLAASLGRLYRSLHRLSGMPLRARVAAELLDLSGSALATPDDGGLPIVRITHDDLAAAVGSVRETVTKVVGELARMGAVEAGYGRIRLKDEELLRQVAQE